MLDFRIQPLVVFLFGVATGLNTVYRGVACVDVIGQRVTLNTSFFIYIFFVLVFFNFLIINFFI